MVKSKKVKLKHYDKAIAEVAFETEEDYLDIFAVHLIDEAVELDFPKKKLIKFVTQRINDIMDL